MDEAATTLTGGLYSITPRVTRQGRRWLTADLVFDNEDGTQIRHEVQVYPGAHEDLVEHIVAGAPATITVIGSGWVSEMTVGEHRWEAGPGARTAYVSGLRLPWGSEPVRVAQVLQYVKHQCGYLFDHRHLPGSRKPKLAMLLFFMQGHHFAHFHKPLFDSPIYAVESGVSIALPDPAGDLPSNGQLCTVGDVLYRYREMHLSDLRSLIRISDAWQAARNSDGDGEIDHALLDQWFSRDEECNDRDDERPTQREAAVEGRRLRSEAEERREAEEKDGEVA